MAGGQPPPDLGTQQSPPSGISGSSSPEGTVRHDGVKRGEVTAGASGIDASVTLEDSERIRKAWKQRGGGLYSYEMSAAGTVLVIDDDVGGGFGFGGALGYQWSKLPSPGQSTVLFSFRTMLSSSFALTFLTIENSTFSSKQTSTTWNLSPTIGLSVGFGWFGDDGKWRGLVIGVDYKPSLTIQGTDTETEIESSFFSSGSTSTSSDSSTDFNATGFSINLDPTSLDAFLDDKAREAHLRITAFLLPADGFFMATIGLGAVWY